MGILNEDDKDKIQSAALLYTQAVLSAKEKLDRQNKAAKKDKRLHNTKLLLQNYRRLAGYIDNATYSFDKIQDEEALNWYRAMYDPNNRSDQIVASIKNSAIKSRIMVEHIKNTVSIYGEYCNETIGSEPLIRRYEVLYYKYISKKPMSGEELAEKWYVDVRTIRRDLSEAERDISSLIFGMDWLN
jgi:hypothetical protein